MKKKSCVYVSTIDGKLQSFDPPTQQATISIDGFMGHGFTSGGQGLGVCLVQLCAKYRQEGPTHQVFTTSAEG